MGKLGNLCESLNAVLSSKGRYPYRGLAAVGLISLLGRVSCLGGRWEFGTVCLAVALLGVLGLVPRFIGAARVQES